MKRKKKTNKSKTVVVKTRRLQRWFLKSNHKMIKLARIKKKKLIQKKLSQRKKRRRKIEKKVRYQNQNYK